MTGDPGWITVEEWLLLAGLLSRAHPCGIHHLVISINPPSDDPAQHTRWRRRQHELVAVFLRLYRRGLVLEAVPPGRRTADVYELTTTGRHTTVNAHQQWAPARSPHGWPSRPLYSPAHRGHTGRRA